MLCVEIAILSYNEARNIPLVLRTLSEVRARLVPIELKVMIIDNGSKDNTPDVIKKVESEYSFVRHHTIPENKGYGYGIRTGLGLLQGDIVGYMWGDNQFDAAIVEKMIQAFVEDQKVEIVKTYRVKRYDGAFRLWVSKLYQLLFRVLYGIYTRDINSGPKLFRIDFFKKLNPLVSDDWFIDAEIMIKATKLITPSGVKELPITFLPRKFGKSNVRFSTCFEFFWNLIKYKFTKL